LLLKHFAVKEYHISYLLMLNSEMNLFQRTQLRRLSIFWGWVVPLHVG